MDLFPTIQADIYLVIFLFDKIIWYDDKAKDKCANNEKNSNVSEAKYIRKD